LGINDDLHPIALQHDDFANLKALALGSTVGMIVVEGQAKIRQGTKKGNRKEHQ
jgi:hypothetical protein